MKMRGMDKRKTQKERLVVIGSGGILLLKSEEPA